MHGMHINTFVIHCGKPGKVHYCVLQATSVTSPVVLICCFGMSLPCWPQQVASVSDGKEYKLTGISIV